MHIRGVAVFCRHKIHVWTLPLSKWHLPSLSWTSSQVWLLTDSRHHSLHVNGSVVSFLPRTQLLGRHQSSSHNSPQGQSQTPPDLWGFGSLGRCLELQVTSTGSMGYCSIVQNKDGSGNRRQGKKNWKLHTLPAPPRPRGTTQMAFAKASPLFKHQPLEFMKWLLGDVSPCVCFPVPGFIFLYSCCPGTVTPNHMSQKLCPLG